MTNHLDVAILRRGSGGDQYDLYSADFLVDGVSLFQATRADQQDMAGCFMHLSPAGVNERQAKMFMGELPPELPPDRVGLFVCPLCGSLDCGAITLRLTCGATSVRWSDFAYENTATECMTDFERYAAIGPFEFDRDAYGEAIRKALVLVQARKS